MTINKCWRTSDKSHRWCDHGVICGWRKDIVQFIRQVKDIINYIHFRVIKCQRIKLIIIRGQSTQTGHDYKRLLLSNEQGQWKKKSSWFASVDC